MLTRDEEFREAFDYQTVAIVKSSHGILDFKGFDYCHPGLHYENQRWSERFAKFFERSLVQPKCPSNGKSSAEMEVVALSNFFNSACRPGQWSNDVVEDQHLKKNYQGLCKLCGDAKTCSYTKSSTEMSDHRQALECANKLDNAITYVDLKEAQKFFESEHIDHSQFSFLCFNGDRQPILNNTSPCVWLSQPWSLVVSSTNPTKIDPKSIKDILFVKVSNRTLEELSVNEFTPVPTNVNCSAASIRWCTQSIEEKKKCDVIRTAAVITGIFPNITCNEPSSNLSACLSDVSNDKADFVGIDSNFGYLARK